MSTGSLIVADLVVAVLAAGAWLGAGSAAAAGRRRVALGLGVGAVVVTLARGVTVVLLARAGWWFVSEKVLIGVPLSVAALVAGAVWLATAGAGRRRAVAAGGAPGVGGGPGSPRAVIGPLFAGYSSAAALLVTVLHGYPATAGAALLAVAGVGAATLVTWRLLGGRGSRVAVGAVAAALVAGTAFAVTPFAAASGAPHRHDFAGAPPSLVPDKRFVLTAGTATVKVGGDEVKAWAFDGQVPGPALTATVGDVLEVTLRNRDIRRGVTLHWHGYDVPNSQDGVPDVTQPAVLPGQEFVYRFRAAQAGTYWYHTHAVSNVGVRMGLYGVLVVRPAPVPHRGVEVIVPVHTLAGHVLPMPVVASPAAGTPVRFRLINTDSTTHRFALAGAPFLVAAIDGSDLSGPTEISGRAVSIPAGGRYDLTLTTPDAPIALFVDGRIVYATGNVPTAVGGWPVLDPLTYGAPAPVPFPHYDRDFTLVLDRGLDLRGLLPRYAHTVNGASYPDIADQVVRYGDNVRFTIVNRSLVVHPWHLHGHHVLVLSRNGRPARGSPLWLDSFDVRPGEVWQVAFVARNPGMWANHCHNLPHADNGMMLHLRYAE